MVYTVFLTRGELIMKYAYVTGTDRGVGLALAENLLNRGYHLFAGEFALTTEGNKAGIPTVGMDDLTLRFSERLTRIPLDCGSTASVKMAGNMIRETTDCLDLLVSNAAILGDIKKTVFDDWNDDDFVMINRVYNVNTTGNLRVISSVISLLKNPTDLSVSPLVIISSEASQIPQTWRTGWFGYCQSKAAINSLGSLVYNSVKDMNIPVLLFHPGHVRTYMSGTKNMNGEIEPEESAAGIIEFVLERNHSDYGFFDYKGEPMSW
jgi:NAD(P)-dependent dehydrogenase (short-subunit alcohol dehydrogenase family)